MMFNECFQDVEDARPDRHPAALLLRLRNARRGAVASSLIWQG